MECNLIWFNYTHLMVDWRKVKKFQEETLKSWPEAEQLPKIRALSMISEEEKKTDKKQINQKET